jgi:hypothetical protein
VLARIPRSGEDCKRLYFAPGHAGYAAKGSRRDFFGRKAVEKVH